MDLLVSIILFALILHTFQPIHIHPGWKALTAFLSALILGPSLVVFFTTSAHAIAVDMPWVLLIALGLGMIGVLVGAWFIQRRNPW